MTHKGEFVSSKLDYGNHKPALDIDLPVTLTPSTTPGHFHLYIDKEMTWKRYALLLIALSIAGVVERKFVYAAFQNKQTFLKDSTKTSQQLDTYSERMEALWDAY